MNLYPISVAPTIILCLLTIFAAASYNQDYLMGDISVNCGSTGTSVAIDGREWHGDMNAEDDSSLQVKGASSSSSVISQLKATADPVPYKTARISRSTFSYAFQVDPGLKLIRLHFNPTRYKGFKVSKDLFTVESRAVILLDNFSPSVAADALGVNTFVKEFLQSRDESIDRKRPLKGFEIFKLSNPDNSLACPNQMPTAQNFQSGTSQNLVSVLGYSNAVATAVIFMIVFVNIIVHRLRQLREENLTTKENKPPVKGERLCLRFSLDEICAAAQNFNDELIIGHGGFGTVYKGLLGDGGVIVAIKRLRLNSRQGEHEFWREIETLSELRHLNLVSLIGYCNENHEMILVYDYMPRGTLADHLYKKPDDSNNSPSLTWNQRLSICIGAGRGLDYLHTGHGIIHRDVKSSNILLDENFVAKVSDFGLAKPETRNMLHSYVSTNVKGTFGYFDPHYFRTHKLTRKSDTYAFGVVLLEVLCGRLALDLRVDEDKQSLTMWAQEKISEGEVEKIISSDLRGDISLDSLKTFVKIVESCLNDEPKRRPTMAQVVLQLEFALKQHESSRQVTDEKDVSDGFPHTDEIISSASTENLTITSIDELNSSSSSKEQNFVNAKLISGERIIGSITKHQKYWQWNVLRKRAKRSPKDQLEDSISGQNKLLMKRQVSLLKDYVTGLRATKLDWATINLATNRFSHSNMIGKGLGGAYYKAVLPTRQVIAVKRSSLSEYGHNEFKHEIYLLSELQHPNLTKLLGYTIHGEELMLAYEFKAETSLHSVLFGRDQLPWTNRFKIIRGIAEGVLYLHQDLELRKFYSDLEPHNIILDTEMNPKISFDFENKPGKDLPLVLLDDKSYMYNDYASVEYNSSRQISVSSDIHSFGVMVLEIVSGMAHRRSSKEGLDLIAYAWKLWNEDKPLYLMEASTWISGFSHEEVLRCIRVGLLCTQQQPKKRPMMPLILRSLQGYHELQLGLKETGLQKTIHSTSSSIHKWD